MSGFIVRDAARGVNTSTRGDARGCDDDAALRAAHRRLVGLDMAGVAELVLAETDRLPRDERHLLIRLGAIRLAAEAGVRRHE